MCVHLLTYGFCSISYSWLVRLRLFERLYVKVEGKGRWIYGDYCSYTVAYKKQYTYTVGGKKCLNNKNKGTSGQCVKLDGDLRRGGTALKITAFFKDL